MATADRLKRFFHTYIHPGFRFAPDWTPAHGGYPISACRMDSGELPVIYTSSSPNAPLGAANVVGRHLVGRPAVFLVWLPWAARRPGRVRWLATAAAVYRRRRPEHRVVMLCNELEEQDALRAAGVEAVFCSHNAIVDEETFTPLATRERVFDAVYNAALAPWKRHHLARLVEKCAFLFYRKPDASPAEALAYLAELRALMPRHHFINAVVGERVEFIGLAQVNALLAQCGCGLCLSAEEGAMFASIEYLLAGLPVVSTPSLGGRDVFADPAYWLTVADTPEAVRDGVAEALRRDVRPQDIRARTLERIHRHRATMRDTVAEATDGKVILPADLTSAVYRRKRDWMEIGELRAALGL